MEALDAVILDGALAARIDESQLSGLLAAGTTVAIQSQRRPAGEWPWVRAGELWVVRHEPVGPVGVIEPIAYEPTYGWLRGWPADVRRRTVLAAAMGAVLLLAASLWRSRWAAVAVLAASAVICGFWVVWAACQSPVLEMSGNVIAESRSLQQEDRWFWYSPLRSTAHRQMIDGLVKPVLASVRQIDILHLQLRWEPARQIASFVYELKPSTSLAFFRRNVTLEIPHLALRRTQSSLASMVKQLYVQDSDELLGEVTDGTGATTVVVAAKKTAD